MSSSSGSGNTSEKSSGDNGRILWIVIIGIILIIIILILVMALTTGADSRDTDLDCVSNADCPANMFCLNNVCVTPDICTSDADCPTNQSCHNGQCVDYVKCVCTADCGPGEICQGNKCVCQVPFTPTGVQANSAGATSVEVSWNTTNSQGTYTIYYSTIQGFNTSHAIKISGITASPHTVTNLSTGITYYFRVSCDAACGFQSALSDEVSAVPCQVLPTPQNPTFTQNSFGLLGDSVEANITFNPVPGADYYNIYVSRTPGFNIGDANVSVLSTNNNINLEIPGTIFTPPDNFRAITTWYCRITAVGNTCGESLPTDEIALEFLPAI